MNTNVRYFKFEYLVHLPNKNTETGVGYMKRRSFDPNIAKTWVKTHVTKGVGDVTLLPHTEILKDEFDLNIGKSV